ncbi:MAG TPA: NAD(P)H-dependent glycerol-3-phosphate dehydrogenase [Rubrivivax sp.]|nr:NAD(P)H-dependent glycerol-3-phosphate dehydrogenase [Rubrivivax sp.]
MRLTVFGAGAWGTALAVALAARQPTLLWVRDPAAATDLQVRRCNRRYLPEVTLPAALRIESDWETACAHAEQGLAIVATPMSGLRDVLTRLPGRQAVLWLSKGFEQGTRALGHEIARDLAPDRPCGVLSGPSFALEVARGQPTALVVASDDDSLARVTAEALHGLSLRVYRSTDVVGVEVGGAVKNVLAIATGVLDGLATQGPVDRPGLNARAALITRGLAEMTRLGVALGGRPETFMGLSGLGDLVLTATGALSRNRQVGLQLAGGLSVQAVLAGLGHVAEGVFSAHMVVERARRAGVEMPIASAVDDLLAGRLAPAEAVSQLMSRQARAEA